MTSGDYSLEAGTWAPVIYGRTHHADEWWRALPAGVTRNGPAAQVIRAAIADGRVPAPRFVLARLDQGTLVGVTCAPSQFGSDMASDSHGRPLYCFVGWYSPDSRVEVPGFAELTAGWERLVGAEYERAMRPVWLASAAEARVPRAPAPGQAPWPAPSGPRLEDLPGSLSSVVHPGDVVRVYPSAQADLVWQAVADHGVQAAVVTGWETHRPAISPYLTHVSADDVSGPAPLVVQAPPRPEPAAPGPAPAASAQPGYQGGSSGASWPAGRDGTRHEHERSHDRPGDIGTSRETPSPGGGMVARMMRAVSDYIVGGDDDYPPDPPTWDGAWTFRPPASFVAGDASYVFQYTIGRPAIRCMQRHSGMRFDWTGSGWVPVEAKPQAPTPARAATPSRYQDNPPGTSDRDLLDEPPVTDLKMATPQSAPDQRQKLNSTFSGFNRSARARPGDAAAGAGPRAGAASPGGSSPDAEGGTETGQATPPEWSPDES